MWEMLVITATLGVITSHYVFLPPVRTRAAILTAIPFVQAITYVFVDWCFCALFGRAPASFDEARFGKNIYGERHWADIAFWLFIQLLIMVAPVFISAAVGIELPSRNFPWRFS